MRIGMVRKIILFIIEMIIISLPMVQWELNRSNYDYLNMANEVIQTNKRDLNITHDYNRPDALIYKGSDGLYYVELYRSESIVYRKAKNDRHWQMINPYGSDRQLIYRQLQHQNIVWHQKGTSIRN